jgi:hypothetical protein
MFSVLMIIGGFGSFERKGTKRALVFSLVFDTNFV